jgi:hypothetical protein
VALLLWSLLAPGDWRGSESSRSPCAGYRAAPNAAWRLRMQPAARALGCLKRSQSSALLPAGDPVYFRGSTHAGLHPFASQSSEMSAAASLSEASSRGRGGSSHRKCYLKSLQLEARCEKFEFCAGSAGRRSCLGGDAGPPPLLLLRPHARTFTR